MYILIDLQVAPVYRMQIAGQCALLNASTADTQEARSFFQFHSHKQEKNQKSSLCQERCSPMAIFICFLIIHITQYTYRDRPFPVCSMCIM